MGSVLHSLVRSRRMQVTLKDTISNTFNHAVIAMITALTGVAVVYYMYTGLITVYRIKSHNNHLKGQNEQLMNEISDLKKSLLDSLTLKDMVTDELHTCQ